MQKHNNDIMIRLLGVWCPGLQAHAPLLLPHRPTLSFPASQAHTPSPPCLTGAHASEKNFVPVIFAQKHATFGIFRFSSIKSRFWFRIFWPGRSRLGVQNGDNSVYARRNRPKYGPSDVRLRAVRFCFLREFADNARSPGKSRFGCNVSPPRPDNLHKHPACTLPQPSWGEKGRARGITPPTLESHRFYPYHCKPLQNPPNRVAALNHFLHLFTDPPRPLHCPVRRYVLHRRQAELQQPGRLRGGDGHGDARRQGPAGGGSVHGVRHRQGEQPAALEAGAERGRT